MSVKPDPRVAHARAITSPALADLLEGYRDEVVAAWVKLLYSMEESHYRERPVTELQHSTGRCLAGLVTLFRTGSYDGLADYSQETCAMRAEQGFDISEVIEGHLLLDEAVLPIIRRECQWDLGRACDGRGGSGDGAGARFRACGGSSYASASSIRSR